MKRQSERRSSLRRPIHHEALMKTEGDLELTCIIADFCLDGMFIKFMGESANRVVDIPDIENNEAEIELHFKGDQGTSYSINAEIVHHLQGACGLRFVKRYDAAVQSLVNLAINTGVSSDHSLPVQTILDECIVFIHKSFEPLLKNCWDVLEEELRAEAVKASNDQQGNALMALAEKIKQRRSKLHSSVMSAIDDPVAAFNLHLEKRKSMNDRLSIIDKEEFEDWLVSRVLVMRCEADYQSLLLPLKLRLDALGVGDKRHHQSVFGPALMVSAFQPVIQALIVDGSTEKLIFKVFQNEVMFLLKGIYEGLNAILIRHNILPKLDIKQPAISKNVGARKKAKPTTKTSTSSESNKQGPLQDPESLISSGSSQKITSGSHTLEGGNFHTPSGIDQSSQTYTLPPFSSASNLDSSNSFTENQQNAQAALSNISSLLRSLKAESEIAEVAENSVSYSSTEFEEGLSDLQANTETIDLEEVPRSLMDRVQEKLSQTGEQKNIDETKKAAIDVVDRFFLSMRNNPRISTEAKQYLLKLEVPVLKVLLNDERFFDDQQSSVRAVMNRIAQLGATGAKLNPASREKVSQLVHKIIKEFENDTTVFDTVLAELNQLLDRQNNLYVKNVERVAAAAEGSHKVEEANRAVTHAINDRIAHKFVPSAVVTLINEGWKEYLNLSFIKFGEASEQWNEGLSVIDRLIAYGEDPRIPIDIKVILPKIQEGLKLVSGNNEASTNVRDALKAFILNAPKGLHLSEQAQLLQMPETEEDILSRNIHKSQELKDWILKIKSIKLGSWLQFHKEDKDLTYMRLVWVAKGYSKFVFVNHQGMKVIELGLFKLANYFKDGRIKVDSDYELPIVNQGLDDMVKDVYDKLAYESSHDVKTGLATKTEFCRQVKAFMKEGKRTAACCMLFIHFRNEAGLELELPDSFETELVKILDELFNQNPILGRLGEPDFIIFGLVNDDLSYRMGVQQAVISLCQKSEYLELGLIASVGESRAHLGFNNPESMIKHACEAINYSLEVKKENVVKVKHIEETGDANTAPEEEKNTNHGVEITEANASVVIDEEAEKEAPMLTLNQLVFDLWGQSVAALQHEPVEGGVKSSIKERVQFNLYCVIPGDSQTYAPTDKDAAMILDQWWVKKLPELHTAYDHTFQNIQHIRIPMSAYVLNDDAMLETLSALTSSEKISPAKIYFDIYDCYLIKEVELAAIRMNKLKDLGFKFCLDHFGSDRSPFSYLKALPIDMIKIDDAFISALNNNDETGELATDSIVEIAHYMKKKVLATGVDSAVCLQKMKHLKVDFAQGSTLSPIEKIEI